MSTFTASIPKQEQEDLTQALDWLTSILGGRLVSVVLYGSRARRDHHRYSDYDLLVIAEGLPDDLNQRCDFFQRRRSGLRANASLVSASPELFESHLPALYLDIALDGVVLYDPRGYAQQKIARLRQIIEEAGLYRKPVPDAGFIWKWRDPPPPGRWAIEWDTGLIRDVTRRAG